MKKKIAIVAAAAMVICSLAACGKTTVVVEEAPTISVEEPESTMYVEGEVTYADGSTMTVQDSDGNEYNFAILDATMDLDENGLFEGITVGVTAESEADEDGNYKALEVKEITDPDAEAASDSSDSSDSSSSGGMADREDGSLLDITGTVTYADGSTITVDTDDGDEYNFAILDADVEVDSQGLSEGIVVEVTAQPDPDDNGNYTATKVQEVVDPN